MAEWPTNLNQKHTLPTQPQKKKRETRIEEDEESIWLTEEGDKEES